MKARPDDFQTRKKHLEKYTDQELKDYFYKLIDQTIDPLLNLAYEYTTPAIERSVLMRMGFSSHEAKLITDLVSDHNLIAHGVGHVVYRFALIKKLNIREAGLSLLQNENIKLMTEVFKHDA